MGIFFFQWVLFFRHLPSFVCLFYILRNSNLIIGFLLYLRATIYAPIFCDFVFNCFTKNTDSTYYSLVSMPSTKDQSLKRIRSPMEQIRKQPIIHLPSHLLGIHSSKWILLMCRLTSLRFYFLIRKISSNGLCAPPP